jgi:PAS domain S-box-containing protein
MNAPRADRSAEEELRDRYLALVEQAPDAILIHDGERIVMVNAAATRLAGAERDSALVGRPIDDFLNPPFLRAFEAQLVGGKELVQPAEPIRDTFRRLDGVGVPVDVTAIPFMDGRRLAAHVVIRDVSARLAADAARAAALHAQELHAAQLRVRPVLMTAAATIAALTPLALGVSGEGGIISQSLGTVVIGGLLVATLLTLVIVPAVFRLLDRDRDLTDHGPDDIEVVSDPRTPAEPELAGSTHG